ncbi:cobalamin-binding protein [Paraferrimonas sedimenticola]|uniref:Cobalamin-binding protein n=1 Tax=Paraferrimonas sedimenticola TaxID=375674 RepID=A0AA37W114_9GAMM|nr:cobalamin-binding protein [Paraferrimonas sedimenticola]GLP98124.1 cobalamin-binding protein [Paraferrimonas sedimenticola]
MLSRWLSAFLGLSFCVVASAAPERIIALSPHAVELIFSLESGDKLVGVVEHSDYPRQALKIPRIGSAHGLSYETILALKPDLIVAWEGGTSELALQKLSKLGIKIVYSHASHYQELPQQIRELGEALGKVELADRLATQYLKDMAALQQRYQDKPAKKVFYQLWDSPLMTVANGAWIQSLLPICQLENPFVGLSKAYPQVNLEQVLAYEPEVIIIAQDDEPQRRAVWQQWPYIPAVKNDALVFVNPDRLHRPTLRSLAGIEELCQRVHALD